jgi:integrase
MSETLEMAVEGFLAHKRGIGRKYHSEEHELALLVRFAEQHGACRLGQLTPALLEEFLASRPRSRPRSFNHLLGVVAGLLDWAVTFELLEASPLKVRRRRVTSAHVPFLFDASQARCLLQAAAVLPDNSRARGRGPTYRAIFALCYGLGLRAGEACGLRLSDVDIDRSLLVVRGGKFGKSRLVPHGPRIAGLVAEQVGAGGRRQGDPARRPLFSFDGKRCIHPGTAARRSTIGFPPSASRSRGVAADAGLRHSFAVASCFAGMRSGPAGQAPPALTFMGPSIGLDGGP